MTYDSREYHKKFMVATLPSKRERELVIVETISDLLNKNKFDNLDELIKKNGTFNEFVKNNNLGTVLKHFEGSTEEFEYQDILTSFKEYSKAKLEFDKTNINTITSDDKQYVTYKKENKELYLDNSRSTAPIEDQLEDLQKTEEKFQTIDATKNTETMMEELDKNKKESINFRALFEINCHLLNDEEQAIFDVAKKYEEETNQSVKLDIEKKLLLFNNEILQIYKKDGIYLIKSTTKEQQNVEEVKTNNAPQKKLVLNNIPLS